MTSKKEDLEHLERVRNLCRAALALGLAASLGANIVAAEASIVGRVVAGWPPLVLMIVVELIGRVSVNSGWLSLVRLATAGGIAGVAALVSYKHMLEVAELAGEGTIEAHLIPLTVDGLVVVASISLVGLNQRIRSASPRPKPPRSDGPTRPASKPPTGPVPEPSLATLPALTATNNGNGSERSARAAELAATGLTQQQIAEELGVSVRTVRRDLKEGAVA